MITTRRPLASSSATTCEPMYPAPPVASTVVDMPKTRSIRLRGRT